MKPPDGSPGILLSRRSNRAGVENHQFRDGRVTGGFESAFPKLLLNGGAVRLRCAATEI